MVLMADAAEAWQLIVDVFVEGTDAYGAAMQR